MMSQKVLNYVTCSFWVWQKNVPSTGTESGFIYRLPRWKRKCESIPPFTVKISWYDMVKEPILFYAKREINHWILHMFHSQLKDFVLQEKLESYQNNRFK